MSPSDLDPLDLIDLDHLLSDEEKQIRGVAREWIQRRVLPEVEDWFEKGEFPARDLAKELGELGFFLMQLDTEWTLGLNTVAYGLVELELEAGDSGLRSFVSVQSALAGYAIYRWGSDEQKAEWLPKMASGEAIACFGLSEPDSGSDPGSMRTTAKKDGDDWILNGTKMWITNGSVSDIASSGRRPTTASAGSSFRATRPGFAGEPDPQEAVASGVGHGGAGDGRRAAAGRRDVPRGPRPQGAALVPERGPLWDRLGRDGRGALVPRDRDRVLEDARAVRPADRLLPAHAEEARRHGRSSSTRGRCSRTTSAG